MRRSDAVCDLELGRLAIDRDFLANARALITPGTSLILTDMPVDTNTRSGSDFNILTTSPTEPSGPDGGKPTRP